MNTEMTMRTVGRRGLLLGLGGALAACAGPRVTEYHAAGGQPPAQWTEARNIMGVLAADSTFDRFIELTSRTGLSAVLSGPGPFTVLAYTNAAWDDLPAFTRTSLLTLEDPVRSAALIRHLIIDGRHLVTPMVGQSREFTTRNGTRVTINAGVRENVTAETTGETGFGIGLGSVGLRSARLLRVDVPASNGVIHILRDILVP